MSRPPRDPLVGVERLLVDGTNLLHALRRGAAPAPAATLIGRIRGTIPASIRIELLFDGPPEPGMRGTRIASGVTVRHAGRETADALALRLVSEATGGRPDPAGGAPTLLVVTDDGGLARELRWRGAATIGTSWLIRRLERPRLTAPSVGRPRPAPPPAPPPGAVGSTGATDDRDEGDGARPPWRPGRGATTKHGNARRRPRATRSR